MMINEDSYLGVTCCFCKQSVRLSNVDPCNINIMGHWDREIEDRLSIDFFCHFDCLTKRLHQGCKNSHKCEITESEFICCFCNTIIQSTDIDPCNIEITGDWARSLDIHISNNYSTHLECLRNRVHEYYKGYLADEIFSIEED